MDIDRLRELIVFSETMNYSAAARQLFIAQPTLSQHIRKTEQSLGFDVIDRTNPNAPALTPEGELFIARIQRVIHDFDSIVDDCIQAADKRKNQTLRVYDFGRTGLLDRIRSLGIRAEDVPPTDAIEKLTEFDLIDRGIADVAVTFYPDETLLRHLDSDKLERYSFAPLPDILCPIRMNRNNPLASSDRFFEVPKRNWPVIEARSAALASATNALFGSLTAAGAPVARINVRSVAAINNLLETEIDYLHVLFGGVAPLLSVHDEERGIVTRTFDDLPIRVTPYAIIRKDNPNPSAHRLMKSLAS